MKFLTAIISILFSFQICMAQGAKLEDYKKLYSLADSLNQIEHPTLIDSELLSILNNLDHQEPHQYFEMAGRLYEANKFDESALVFQVALLRYKYFLTQNPNYPPSNNWVTAESFQAVYREKINLYLKTNIDNYLTILKNAVSYHKVNDYQICSKEKSIAQYNKVSEADSSLITEFEKNKEKYQKEWMAERTLKLSGN